MLLLKQIKVAFMLPQFHSDVLKPMNLDNVMGQEVKTLSGGELQRVAIVLALGRLLWDKGISLFCVYSHHCFFSSLLVASFLDSEKRIIASKVIKRCVIWRHKS